MPKQLEIHLPGVNATTRETLFGSITTIATYPPGDPIREGVIQAYDETMKVMLIAATVIALIPLTLALFMPNYYLGDTQNAVEGKTLSGETLAEDPNVAERAKNHVS